MEITGQPCEAGTVLKIGLTRPLDEIIPLYLLLPLRKKKKVQHLHNHFSCNLTGFMSWSKTPTATIVLQTALKFYGKLSDWILLSLLNIKPSFSAKRVKVKKLRLWFHGPSISLSLYDLGPLWKWQHYKCHWLQFFCFDYKNFNYNTFKVNKQKKLG